ncbi:MAG: methyltransferase domain-containing protein [Nostocaceae cyanobacterium]|nr:methyltransferase domain-containing protein [Nostocaceae cyanobacterium]
MLKLNLGCGDQTPKDWTNVDYAMGAWIAQLPVISFINKKLKIINFDWPENIYLYDLTKKFPWADNTVDVIYSSHTLEHLSKTQGLHFLSECYRVLKPNGIVRIVVPDLRAYVDKYIQGEIPADRLLDELYVGYEAPEDGFWKQKLSPFIRFPHKCMYDTPALVRIMSEIGFEAVSKEGFDSEIVNIEGIEIADRTIDAVIVEAKKVPATRKAPVGSTALSSNV